jgi:uncharacterized protein
LKENNKIKRNPFKKALLAIRLTAALAVLTLIVLSLYGFFIEPHWLRLRNITVATNPGIKIIHITDIHYKGDREYLEGVVDTINSLEADYVCFTGDLVEEDTYLAGVTDILAKVKLPLIAIMGNHDHWTGMKTGSFKKFFEAHGQYFLEEETLLLGDVAFHGVEDDSPEPQLVKDKLNILLCHYPAYADTLENRFDLILAGHSHGGQLRIPFSGAISLPWGTAGYDMGLFETPGGPMYVNPGIGTFWINFRFLCRPEITVIEI